MEGSGGTSDSTWLPYLNNFWMVVGTALINAACVLLFHWSTGALEAQHVVTSAVFCGAITSLIDVVLVYLRIKKMRRAGTLPAQAPQNRLLARLPKSPGLLIVVLGAFFGVFTAFANWLLIVFYDIQTFTLLRFVVWQAAYSCLLSAIISEVAVLRFMQADCDEPGQPVQTGCAQVRNPFTRLASLKSWLNTVIDDFGFNMAIGLLLGGTIVVDYNVVILPTTRAGIVVSSLVLGLIVTVRMAHPIAKSMRDARESGTLPPLEKEVKAVSWLPDNAWGFTAALALPIMLLALLVFWAVLTFFGFDTLNFFQFFLIRSVFVAVLSSGVVKLAVVRYMQPMKYAKGQ